ERVHGPLEADAARVALRADFHGRPFEDVLMAPTRIYVKPLLGLLAELPVKAMAHITGGGLLENVPRVLPPTARANIRAQAWPMPPLFDWLREHGQIADAEMHRVFNCGIGMVVIVAAGDADRAIAYLAAAGETAWRIGEVVDRQAGDAPA